MLRIEQNNHVAQQEKGESSRNITSLPPEILDKIFTFLKPAELALSGGVSRTWYSLSRQDHFWRSEGKAEGVEKKENESWFQCLLPTLEQGAPFRSGAVLDREPAVVYHTTSSLLPREKSPIGPQVDVSIEEVSGIEKTKLIILKSDEEKNARLVALGEKNAHLQADFFKRLNIKSQSEMHTLDREFLMATMLQFQKDHAEEYAAIDKEMRAAMADHLMMDDYICHEMNRNILAVCTYASSTDDSKWVITLHLFDRKNMRKLSIDLETTQFMPNIQVADLYWKDSRLFVSIEGPKLLIKTEFDFSSHVAHPRKTELSPFEWSI